MVACPTEKTRNFLSSIQKVKGPGGAVDLVAIAHDPHEELGRQVDSLRVKSLLLDSARGACLVDHFEEALQSLPELQSVKLVSGVRVCQIPEVSPDLGVSNVQKASPQVVSDSRRSWVCVSEDAGKASPGIVSHSRLVIEVDVNVCGHGE